MGGTDDDDNKVTNGINKRTHGRLPTEHGTNNCTLSDDTGCSIVSGPAPEISDSELEMKRNFNDSDKTLVDSNITSHRTEGGGLDQGPVLQRLLRALPIQILRLREFWGRQLA